MLKKGADTVPLSPRLVEILAFLIEQNGAIVTKEQLLDRFWPGVNISDNTLTRAIADIRIALDDSASEPKFIQTLARRGYRFVPQMRASDPFDDWVKGRVALESLDLAQLPAAIAAFERAASELPSYAPVLAGLANAYMLQFETTRFTNAPDRALLERAIAAARRASEADASLGEAWAVLGYLLNAAGLGTEAQSAARRATALEPDNWRHQYRLAYATWGEERLRACDRTIALMPSFAPARMLAATVFVARGVLPRAEQETRLGAELQRQSREDRTPMRAAGLHWLHGLILHATDRSADAMRSFEEEIEANARGHVYGREFAANAMVAAGFASLSLGDRDAALAMFDRALAITPLHARAALGIACVKKTDRDFAAVDAAIADLNRNGRHNEAVLVQAGLLMARDRDNDAAQHLHRVLDQAPSGPAGWILPVDPMLAAIRNSSHGPNLLAKLAARAA